MSWDNSDWDKPTARKDAASTDDFGWDQPKASNDSWGSPAMSNSLPSQSTNDIGWDQPKTSNDAWDTSAMGNPLSAQSTDDFGWDQPKTGNDAWDTSAMSSSLPAQRSTNDEEDWGCGDDNTAGNFGAGSQGGDNAGFDFGAPPDLDPVQEDGCRRQVSKFLHPCFEFWVGD